MSIPVIAFFNNKGGVGKTTLLYHLGWMYVQLGLRVITTDLDPQANLTAAFLDEEELENLLDPPKSPQTTQTIFQAVQPLIRGIGDIQDPTLHYVDEDEKLALIAGDLDLSKFEDHLSEVWPKCLNADERAFRITSAFWRIMQRTAAAHQADVILVDLGPNLGAINRATLIATDYVVVPLAPDIFSLQGLSNLGPALRNWRSDWQDRLERWKRNPAPDLPLPTGQMEPIGYVVLQHAERLDRPVKAYNRWIARIPQRYRKDVLDEDVADDFTMRVADDPLTILVLKRYSTLIPMAQEAHKPMFHLKAADGAIGSHIRAVHGVYKDFKQLAQKIAELSGIAIPQRMV